MAIRAWLLALATLVATTSVLAADARHGTFTDPADGKFDLSEWLLDRKGFLPVPIIITEPAVGYGGGVAALFFRESIREAAQAAKGGRVTPPDIFGVALVATENGTKAAGVGGMFSFDQDRWRYRGGVGKADLRLDFYGIGGTLGTGDFKLGYSLDGFASSQQLLRRLGDSDHFLGLRWIYLDLDSKFESSRPRPLLPDKSFATRSSGLGLAWEHDSRDNIFTPSRGWIGSLDAMFYAPGLGSDNAYQTYRAHAYVYTPIGKSLVLGTRLDGRAARGDVPFYQLPFIDMRGIPAARYQDRNAAVLEAELRWNLTQRWGLVGFLGAGRVWGERESLGDSASEVGKGVGARYLIARRLGLYVGVDFAWGPEDRAFYIQVGSAWR